VVSKQMVKKQHMRWTPDGAHLRLQVRTRTLTAIWRPPTARGTRHPPYDRPIPFEELPAAA